MVMPPNMVVIGFDLSPYRLINNVLSLGSSPDFLRNVHTYHTNRKQTRHTTPYVLCTVSACLVEFVRHPTGSVAKAQLKKNKITSPLSIHSKISTYVPCPQSIWYNHTWMEHYSNWNLENQLVGLSQSRSCRSVKFWNSCYSAALTQHRRCIPFLQSFIYVGGHHHKKKRSKYQITRPGIRSMETTIFKNLHTFGIITVTSTRKTCLGPFHFPIFALEGLPLFDAVHHWSSWDESPKGPRPKWKKSGQNQWSAGRALMTLTGNYLWGGPRIHIYIHTYK